MKETKSAIHNQFNPLRCLHVPPDDEGECVPVMNGNRPATVRSMLLPVLDMGIVPHEHGRRLIDAPDLDLAVDLALRMREGKPLELSTAEAALLNKLIADPGMGMMAWHRQVFRCLINPADVPEPMRGRMLAVLAKPLTVTLPGRAESEEVHAGLLWSKWLPAEKAFEAKIKAYMNGPQRMTRQQAVEQIVKDVGLAPPNGGGEPETTNA